MFKPLLAAQLNAHGLPDILTPVTSIHRVQAMVKVTCSARFTDDDRERVSAGVEYVLTCAKDAGKASVMFDDFLKRTGGRSRIPVKVTFTNVEIPVTTDRELYITPIS